MSKLRFASMLLAVLIAGFFAGLSAASVYWIRRVATDMTSTEFGAVSDTFVVLKALRGGDTNQAINSLEDQLDGHLLAFGTQIWEVPAAKRRPEHTRLIARIRDYRTAFPRKSDSPELEQFIGHILSFTNTESQKP